MKVKKWTGKESIAIDTIIKHLNEILKTDHLAIKALVNHRVICNNLLAKHPTVQVGLKYAKPKRYLVGLLGILNGVLGIDKNKYGPITMHVDDFSNIIKFTRTRTLNQG